MVVASAGWEITICVGWAYAVEAASSSASRQAKIFIGLLRSGVYSPAISRAIAVFRPPPQGAIVSRCTFHSHPSPPLGERAGWGGTSRLEDDETSPEFP